MKFQQFIQYGALAAAALFFTTSAFADDAAPAAAAGPTDPQIAQIVVTANQVDIDAGKYAKSHAKSKDVKAFANTMITDHTAVNTKAKALCKKLKVKPEASPTSKALADGGKENLKNLKKLKGADFDKAYVDHEVAYHQQVIDAVNNTLLPNAKNPDLKQLLTDSAPAFVAHLDHAKKLQADMPGSGAGDAK